jgi:hypothetical protein
MLKFTSLCNPSINYYCKKFYTFLLAHKITELITTVKCFTVESTSLINDTLLAWNHSLLFTTLKMHNSLQNYGNKKVL